MPEDVVFSAANFKKGGYIIIEDQTESDEFYIIRQGKVAESRSASMLEGDKETVLGVGDFFGVISCMSRRPRIETVQAIEDTSTIVVKREQFGALIQKNAPIAMKILRYFGKQLRYYDSVLTKLTLRSSLEEDPNHLFDLGEYFYTNQLFNQAAYAYAHYIKFCPEGGYIPQAKQKLAKINPNPDSLLPKKEGFYSIYNDGQVIFLEHEPGNELYIIQEGKVKITKFVNNAEVLLAVLKKGDIFGEMSLLDNKPRSASAIAFGPVKVMAINKTNFEPTVQAHPEIATRIIELLSERIWLIYRQLANLLIKDPVNRIYDALYTQLYKARVNFAPNVQYQFDFGPDELMKFLGFSKQEWAMHFKKFLDLEKTVSINEGKILCRDVSSIEKNIQIIKRNIELEQKKKTISNVSSF